MKTVLHVGCGQKGLALPPEYGAYKEVRLDCDPSVDPDVLASVVAMPMVPDNTHNAVFASHVLEHLYRHEVAQALAEFLRVLKPGGKFECRAPDLQSVTGRVAMDEAESVVYQSGLGPVTPLDMIYGMRSMVAAGNHFMAHRCGFTKSVMEKALFTAGFGKITVDRDASPFELKARGFKGE